MSENDGGPAFPIKDCYWLDENDEQRQCVGISVRDYFAAKAMQAMIRNHCGASMDNDKFDEMISRYSYEIADAMLAARTK